MSPHRKLFRSTIISAAVLATFQVQARQAPTPAPSAETAPAPKDAPKAKAEVAPLQKIEVRGSTEAYDPRRDDTASKIVVSHEEIIRYGDTNVLDVLKRLPGITVSGASGRGGGEVRMRGLGSGYTQILINGERAPAGFSMDSLAPDVIERIEVLRAASAEFSTQSIAGTINIVLKKAIKNAQRELKVGLAGGSGFLSPNMNLQLSDRAGIMSYSVSLNAFANRFHRESPIDEDGVDLAGQRNLERHTSVHERGHFDGLNLAPRINWNLANGDTVTSQSFLNAYRFHRDGETRVVNVLGTALPFANIDDVTDGSGQTLRSDLNWVHKFGAGAKLDVKFGLNASDNKNQVRQNAFDHPGTNTLERRIDADSTEKGCSYTGKYSTPVVEGHALSVGWEGGYNKRDDTRHQSDAALGGNPGFASDEDFDATVSRLALYAQDEWNLTPRWSVYLGGRWEGIKTRSAGSTFDSVDSRTSVWSPLFQTLWKLPGSKSDQLRFAVTRTYKAPPTQSLIPRRFTATNNSPTDPDRQGNPNLKPELALGLDASYEHYWGEGALFSASASMRTIDGFTRNGLILDSGRWVSQPINDGKAHTKGLELEAKFPLKSLIEQAPGIDLRASISRNWSSVDAVAGPNNRLDQQTPLSATLGMDYKSGALTVGGSYAFKNGGPVKISATQGAYVSVRRDLEVYSLWKFDPKNQLRVALTNILQQDFINDSTYTDSSGTLRRTARFPGVVVLRATMEMKF